MKFATTLCEQPPLWATPFVMKAHAYEQRADLSAYNSIAKKKNDFENIESKANINYG